MPRLLLHLDTPDTQAELELFILAMWGSSHDRREAKAVASLEALHNHHLEMLLLKGPARAVGASAGASAHQG